ncbi:hypothetical protein PHET_08119 [Paragonimus heterotremus]|uniref:Uncharacterized protein n=1 Tax=Paragonimus heterotremus TaxID=100268 RepID=A0A8J4TE31_9TREM|nr:hypothetical protein PHET_08119 [Paragonimus heterotremus]
MIGQLYIFSSTGPKGHDHQPDLCEGLCVPHLILSTAFACVQGELTETNTLPKAVAALLELIIQSWPPADLSSTIQNLWNDVTTTFLSNVVMTNSYPSDLPVQGLQFPASTKTDNEETEECQKSTALSLPPLATPSVDKSIPFADDSRYFSCQKIQRSRIMSVHIPIFDLNDPSDGDYKPISPDLQFYKRNSGHTPFTVPMTESASIKSNASSHATCPIDLNREERTAQSLFQPAHPAAFSSQSVDVITKSLSSVDLGPTHTSSMMNPFHSGCSGDRTVGSDCNVLKSNQNLSGDPLSTKVTSVPVEVAGQPHSEWPSERSYELALASQLALLLLPPFLYGRLQVLVSSLQQVLRNHSHLAQTLSDDYVTLIDWTVKTKNTQQCDTLETVLNVLSQMSASLLFPTMTIQDSSLTVVENDLTRTKSASSEWKEQLTQLLLCDSIGFILRAPVNLAKYIQSLTGDAIQTSGPLSSSGSACARCNCASYTKPNEFLGLQHPVPRPKSMVFVANQPYSLSLSSLNHATTSSYCPLPICVPSIASANRREVGRRTSCSVTTSSFHKTTSDWLASTPLGTSGSGRALCQHCRSHSAERFLPNTLSHHACAHMDQSRPPAGCQSNVSTLTGRWRATSCTSAIETPQSDIDPQRLASLGNTAHLIKLLNQIINDRQMDPRRKMKCVLDFRKSHADVFWLRFGDQQTASNYLVRLQRRIDAQAQPSVLERITNAFRRRRQSPSKHRPATNKSESPTRTAINEAL